MTKKTLAFNSQVIHAGQELDPSTGAVMPPIYLTSTYAQKSPGVHQGFEYSRSQNPTRFAYERCIASLENGKQGFAFASGLAACSTVMGLLQPGDHLLAMDDLYGGTFRLFDQVTRRNSNIDCDFIDMSCADEIVQAIKPETKMIWLESMSNPLLKLIDIAAICKIAKQHNLLVVCDNTFATPYNLKPLDLGVDIVLHSATKYINGHSDVINGIVVVGDNPELQEQMAFLQNAMGAIAGAFDSYLALRGVKTLAVRMDRHNANAMQLAQWLEQQPQIEKVIYPGLTSHPQHDLAKQQMQNGFSGMIAAYLKGGEKESRLFLEKLNLFILAESLGGVESLIEHPAIMTHASIPAEQRAALGINDNMVRISVGIEDVADLQADLAQALA
jgi:cystathionine gamma-lyase